MSGNSWLPLSLGRQSFSTLGNVHIENAELVDTTQHMFPVSEHLVCCSVAGLCLHTRFSHQLRSNSLCHMLMVQWSLCGLLISTLSLY